MGRRCCCTIGCELAVDDFTRTTDGPVPANDPKWIDVDEVWSFDSGHLVSSEEGPVVTRTRRHRQAKQPPAEKRYNYVVYFQTAELGTPDEEHPDLVDEFGVIVHYEDSTNFEWVKFELSATGTSLWPSFIRRADGVDTVLMDKISHPAGEALSIDDDGTFTGRICYADVEWSVTSSGAPPDSGPAVEPPWTLCGGGAAALPASPYGFVGFLYGRFDSWAYYDHWETSRDCPRCSCWCEHPTDANDYSCIPEQLMVSIVPQHDPADYSAPRLDGKDFLLKQVAEIGPSGAADLSPAKRRWKAQEEVDSRYHPSASFWLTCSDGLNLKTDFDGIYWSPTGSGDRPVDWADSTCRPLKLVFKSIGSSATQCDDGVSIRLEADATSDCIPDTPENVALLDGLRWDIIITEVA